MGRAFRSVRWVLLVSLAVSASASVGLAEPAAPRHFEGPFHLAVVPKRRVHLRLEGTIDTPKLRGKEWILVAPVPPDHAWQKVERSSFRLVGEGAPDARAVAAEEVKDASPLARPLRRLHVRTHKGVSTLPYLYEADAVLYAVRLEPGAPAEVPTLSDTERALALAATGRYDFDAPEFQAWRKSNGLLRGPGERDLDFAYRVLARIHDAFTYRYPPRLPARHATDVCREGASDCGGLSVLFASALRAEKIPARVLVGRWALPGKEEDSQFHVRAEFFAEGVGWVPVDGSGAVTWKGAPASAFGLNRAQFFVMHVDPDVQVDTIRFGVQSLTWMQTPAFWVRGSGTLEGTRNDATWKVLERPLGD